MKKIIYFLPFLIFIISLSVFAACASDNSDLPTNNGSGGIVNPKPGGSNDGETNIYTLTYSSTEGGRIEGGAVQTVKSGEQGTSVLAVPDDGYKFLGWSDGYPYAERQDNSVTGNKTFTAQFSKKTYKLQYKTTGEGSIVGKISQFIKYGEDAEEVTAVAGDGAYFVEWSDGNKNPVRRDFNVTENQIITAKFEYFEYTITYRAGEYGKIYSNGNFYKEVVQTVKYGDQSQYVQAVPEAFYKFVRWSDDVVDNFRIDKNVTKNITVTAEFIGEEINIRFSAGNGGKITGKLQQTVKYGDYCEEVVAMPDQGYVFVGWSNGEMDNHLKLRAEIRGSDSEYEFIAYFSPIEKHFRYDCGNIPVTPPQEGITLKRDDLLNSQFYIPECEGYNFLGWYADKEYKLKVADSDGRYMLGYYAFTLDTDTLYARWAKEGETDGKIVHKVLFVMPQEIHASFKTRDDYLGNPNTPWDNLLGFPSEPLPEITELNYVMNPVEYIACGLIIQKFEELLNSWFANTNIRFEVDSYYTLSSFLQENFTKNLSINPASSSYIIKAYNIPELGELNPLYHNVIVMQGMHDYYGFVRECRLAGLADRKYANVFLDGLFFAEYSAGLPFEHALLVSEEYPSVGAIRNGLCVSMHEFCHTCEKYFGLEGILEFHKYNCDDEMETARKYLLGEAEYAGHTSKVLIEKYFVNDFDILVRYNDINSLICEIKSSQVLSWGGNVRYGSDVTVEVIPNEGYRFVIWSDGVSTAKRTDKNIISYLNVYPIVVERTALEITQHTIEENGKRNEEGIGGYFILRYCGKTIKSENIDMDFPKGTVVTVEAVPNEGYKFVSWMNNILETKLTFTIDSYINFDALFRKERTALEIRQETTDDGESVREIGGGYFIINYNGKTIKAENIDMDFPKGAVVTVEAVPNEGYEFLAWLDYHNFIGEIHIDGSKITVKVDCFNKLGALFVNKFLIE